MSFCLHFGFMSDTPSSSLPILHHHTLIAVVSVVFQISLSGVLRLEEQ